MSKSIWCVMSSDEDSFKEVCMGCYSSEDEANKAISFWQISEDYYWIVQHKLYKNFKQTEKELDE